MNNGRSRERGQALIMVTLALLVLMGMLGLVVDLGWAYFTKQSAQSAVDAAALAAVQVAGSMGETTSASYTCPSAPASSTNLQVGCYYASQNGFTVGGAQNVIMSASNATNATVLDLSSAAYPSYTVKTSYWVTARATQSLPQLFSAIMPNHGSMLSSARATAAIVEVALNACAYLLGGSGTDLSITGNANITAQNCGIYVNSTGTSPAPAVSLNGNITLNIGNLNVVPTAGGIGEAGNISLGNTQVNTGAAASPDPLAAFPAPTVSPCAGNTPINISGNTTTTLSGNCGAITIGGNSIVTLNPGEYAGGITIQGNSQVTFNTGTYVIDGGGLNFSGNGSLNGSGVTFYNAFDASHPFAPISIDGNFSGSLSAPTSGALQGMLFFEDRSAPPSTDSIVGNSNLTMTGDLYFPNSTLSYDGNSNGNDVAIVSSALTIVGNSSISQPALPAAGGPAAPKITLIE